ncbi:hypothetical protein [Pseudomonas sp.]|uniref:hypothetical protein n=1 Tax=Pseudomonas sp. TaxID=306 RepID=UPI00257F1E44|nr:hypothetical protein [Pseudomonas sp.]
MFYSFDTRGFYSKKINPIIPLDAVELSAEQYSDLLDGMAAGQIITKGSDGLPLLKPAPPPLITVDTLTSAIDAAADAARLAVAGDPLRATEYERAAAEAQAFKDAGYPAESVPRTVAAWAINGRTAEQAADSILAESAAYTEVLYCLREVRLNGKEQVRAAMDAGNVELAQQITEQTIATINTDIAGVGNNPS